MKRSLDEIAADVEAAVKIRLPDDHRSLLSGPSKDRAVNVARGVFCYVAAREAWKTVPQIAAEVGWGRTAVLGFFNRTSIDLAYKVPDVVSLVRDVAPDLLER